MTAQTKISGKQAWVKIYNTWKGGKREIVNVLVDLFDYNPVNGYYKCFGYRPYSGMNTSPKQIKHVSKSDIVKVIN